MLVTFDRGFIKFPLCNDRRIGPMALPPGLGSSLIASADPMPPVPYNFSGLVINTMDTMDGQAENLGYWSPGLPSRMKPPPFTMPYEEERVQDIVQCASQRE